MNLLTLLTEDLLKFILKNDYKIFFKYALKFSKIIS